MNSRRHAFWMHTAAIVGAALGGLVWFVEASIRMFSTGSAKMPFEAIAWRMYVYPLVGGALVWLLVRFPLMARCAACQAKLRFYRMGSPRYVCPQCGAKYDVDVPVVERQDAAPPAPFAPGRRGVGVGLRRRLYPPSAAYTATWKVALAALGVLALLSACVPVKGLEVDVLGLRLPAALAAQVAWAVWAILNLYLLVGIIWNLADPEDSSTAGLARSRRGLFMALGILFVAISLLAPLFR